MNLEHHLTLNIEILFNMINVIKQLVKLTRILVVEFCNS